MENVFEIDKNQSKMLQGLAILLMVYHHLFGKHVVSSFSLLNTVFNADVEYKIAVFCKICVAIYAFISGYGIYKSISQKEYKTNKDRFVSNCSYCIKHIFSFMKKYWICFAFFIIGSVIFDYPLNYSPITFIGDFLGITHSYNAEWWYVFQYVLMLCALPFVDLFFHKINITRKQVILVGGV